MSAVLTSNLVAVFCVAALGGLFNIAGRSVGDDHRAFSFLWCGWLAVMLSVLGWVIYVAAHFIGKYW